jgi:hypothetical protein
MYNGLKPNSSGRLPRRATPPVARSQRWTPQSNRPNPQNFQNAQRSYERYLALAQTEAQIGNTVGAENYYHTPNIISE